MDEIVSKAMDVFIEDAKVPYGFDGGARASALTALAELSAKVIASAIYPGPIEKMNQAVDINSNGIKALLAVIRKKMELEAPVPCKNVVSAIISEFYTEAKGGDGDG